MTPKTGSWILQYFQSQNQPRTLNIERFIIQPALLITSLLFTIAHELLRVFLGPL